MIGLSFSNLSNAGANGLFENSISCCSPELALLLLILIIPSFGFGKSHELKARRDCQILLRIKKAENLV